MSILKLLLFFSVTFCVSGEVTTRWFNVPVGHYNPLIRRFFDLRYFVNSEHYVPGGPIYVYIGGGTEVYDEFLTQGLMYEIAKETGGYLFALEHRYFGESRPQVDTSVPNLAFLTIHQVITDIGEFIAFVKENYFRANDSKVILWGRGNGGSLAVWSRHKFHHLIDGVWASSAPLNAVTESLETMINAADTIRSIGGQECYQVLQQAFRLIDDAVRLRNTSYVEERLRLCSRIDLDDERDISQLFFGISSDIALGFVTLSGPPEIIDACAIMTDPENPPTNPLEAFSRWFVDDFNRNAACISASYTEVIERFSNVEWDSAAVAFGSRQTLWLLCSQLGQFASSGSGDGHPFGWRFDVNYFRTFCADLFGHDL